MLGENHEPQSRSQSSTPPLSATHSPCFCGLHKLVSILIMKAAVSRILAAQLHTPVHYPALTEHPELPVFILLHCCQPDHVSPLQVLWRQTLAHLLYSEVRAAGTVHGM